MIRFLFSTIAPDARETALKYGLGIEVADFCTASNMDEPDYSVWGRPAWDKIKGVERTVFHAPFNELSPAAIDPMIVDVAGKRIRQAAELSMKMGIRSMIVHSGYIPLIYYKVWQHERSVLFWRELMRTMPEDFEIFIENVMEDDPDMIPGVVAELDDRRIGICLDIGHASASSDVPVKRWIDAASPYLRHMHIHNNDGVSDLHSCPDEGVLDIAELMRYAAEKSPEVTMTFEVSDTERTAKWLAENHFIEGDEK